MDNKTTIFEYLASMANTEEDLCKDEYIENWKKISEENQTPAFVHDEYLRTYVYLKIKDFNNEGKAMKEFEKDVIRRYLLMINTVSRFLLSSFYFIKEVREEIQELKIPNYYKEGCKYDIDEDNPCKLTFLRTLTKAYSNTANDKDNKLTFDLYFEYVCDVLAEIESDIKSFNGNKSYFNLFENQKVKKTLFTDYLTMEAKLNLKDGSSKTITYSPIEDRKLCLLDILLGNEFYQKNNKDYESFYITKTPKLIFKHQKRPFFKDSKKVQDSYMSFDFSNLSEEKREAEEKIKEIKVSLDELYKQKKNLQKKQLETDIRRLNSVSCVNEELRIEKEIKDNTIAREMYLKKLETDDYCYYLVGIFPVTDTYKDTNCYLRMKNKWKCIKPYKTETVDKEVIDMLFKENNRNSFLLYSTDKQIFSTPKRIVKKTKKIKLEADKINILYKQIKEKVSLNEYFEQEVIPKTTTFLDFLFSYSKHFEKMVDAMFILAVVLNMEIKKKYKERNGAVEITDFAWKKYVKKLDSIEAEVDMAELRKLVDSESFLNRYSEIKHTYCRILKSYSFAAMANRYLKNKDIIAFSDIIANSTSSFTGMHLSMMKLPSFLIDSLLLKILYFILNGFYTIDNNSDDLDNEKFNLFVNNTIGFWRIYTEKTKTHFFRKQILSFLEGFEFNRPSIMNIHSDYNKWRKRKEKCDVRFNNQLSIFHDIQRYVDGDLSNILKQKIINDMEEVKDLFLSDFCKFIRPSVWCVSYTV